MRRYRQFCPIARALDTVGERWTLLLIRELLSGPRRYTDLQQGLHGIGPNVLADRLRSLERDGLVTKQRLAPPAASTVYELTALGAGLRPVLASLAAWGLQFLGTPSRDDTIRASYLIPALQAAAHPGAVPASTRDTYELHVNDETITIVARNGKIDIRPGTAEDPDLVARTDLATFLELGRGTLTIDDAIKAGRLQHEGDAVAAERCAAIFSPESKA